MLEQGGKKGMGWEAYFVQYLGLPYPYSRDQLYGRALV